MKNHKQHAPMPLSSTYGEPGYRGTPITHPGAPEGPGATAMDAVQAFRHRTHAVVTNASPRFVKPKQSSKD